MNKQVKLLSVLLAFVMAFCSFCAVASAAVRTTDSTYYTFTADECATDIVDLIDDVLKDQDIDIKVYDVLQDALSGQSAFIRNAVMNALPASIKTLEVDLRSVDSALSSITAAVPVAKGILKGGDIDKLTVKALEGVQRSGGDLNVLYALLQFLNDNIPVLQDAVALKLNLGRLVGIVDISTFFDVNETLGELLNDTVYGNKDNTMSIPEWIKAQLYLAIGIDASKEKVAGYTGDDGVKKTLNEFINNWVAKGAPKLGAIDLRENSVYQLVDKFLPSFFNEGLGLTFFNNGVKFGLATAMTWGASLGVTVTEADEAGVPDGAKDLGDWGVFKDGDKLYVRDYKSEKGWKVFDLSGAKGIAAAIDFDYTLGAFEFASSDILAQVNDFFKYFIDSAFKDEAKAAIGWTAGDNSNFKANLQKLLSWFITNLPAELGEYAKGVTASDDLNTVAYKVLKIVLDMTIDKNDSFTSIAGPISAYIDKADSFEELCAGTVQYFGKIASPTIDSVSAIYTDDAKSDFKTHTTDEWVDIILDLGADIGVYYLNLFTSYDMDKAQVAHYKAAGWKADDFVNSAADWGLAYIGKDTFAAAAEVKDTTTHAGYMKLDAVLNSILPLSFINNVSGNGYVFDFETFLKTTLRNVLVGADGKGIDLIALIDLFRENDKEDNVFNSKTENAIFKIVRQVLNSVLPGAVSDKYIEDGDKLVSVAGLQDLVSTLISSINNNKTKSLTSALPLICSFINPLLEQSMPMISYSGGAVVSDVSQILAARAGVEKKSVASGEYKKILSVGTIFASTEYVDTLKSGAANLTLDKVDGDKIKAVASTYIYTNDANEDGDGDYYFRVVVTGGDTAADDRYVTAVSYVQYLDDAGELNTAYSHALKINFDRTDK